MASPYRLVIDDFRPDANSVPKKPFRLAITFPPA